MHPAYPVQRQLHSVALTLFYQPLPCNSQGPESLPAVKASFLSGLWRDTAAFMGAFIIRRLVRGLLFYV